LNQSEQINELAAALAKAQGAMKNAALNRINPHFKSKYADLSSVFDAIRGPLSANGLSTVQTTHIGERHMILRTLLLHTSGQFIASEYPLPLAGKPQEIGSAMTYAKRYELAAIVGISADDDDDGNAAKPNGHANGNGNGDDKITTEQVGKITKLCAEIGEGTESALCEWKHVASIADLPRSELTSTITALNKKKAIAQAAAAEGAPTQAEAAE
jgi:hypothetical protein